MEIKAELKKPYTENQRIDFIVEYNHNQGLLIKETETELQALDYSDDEKAQQRKAQFYNIFFEIPDFGCYRKQPKGYGSAVESMNTAFNIVTVLGQLPSNTLTFYTKPDFTIEEQCTEDWLIANSFKNIEMTASEFGTFYAQFMTAWNNQEHKESLLVEVENDTI